MKKELKAVCGLVLVVAAVISAGRANAGISIGMEPVAYSVRPAAWGQVSRPSSTDRLSAAAESLAEAANSGDTVGAEEALSGLFSGAARKEAAAPVYIAAKPATPVPAPVARVKRAGFYSAAQSAVPAAASNAPAHQHAGIYSTGPREDDEAAESVSEDEAADADAGAAAEAVAEDGGGEEPAKPKETLWATLLGGGIGMMIVILLICLL